MGLLSNFAKMLVPRREQSSETLSGDTRLNSSPPNEAPLRAPGTRSIAFGSSPAPAPSPAPRSAPVPPPRDSGVTPELPFPDRDIVLELGDVFDRIPAHFVRPGHHNRSRPLCFKISELFRQIAKGHASVPLSSIAIRCPEIFRWQISQLEDMEIQLPLQKVVEQIGPFPSRHAPIRIETHPFVEPPSPALFKAPLESEASVDAEEQPAGEEISPVAEAGPADIPSSSANTEPEPEPEAGPTTAPAPTAIEEEVQVEAVQAAATPDQPPDQEPPEPTEPAVAAEPLAVEATEAMPAEGAPESLEPSSAQSVNPVEPEIAAVKEEENYDLPAEAAEALSADIPPAPGDSPAPVARETPAEPPPQETPSSPPTPLEIPPQPLETVSEVPTGEVPATINHSPAIIAPNGARPRKESLASFRKPAAPLLSSDDSEVDVSLEESAEPMQPSPAPGDEIEKQAPVAESSAEIPSPVTPALQMIPELESGSLDEAESALPAALSDTEPEAREVTAPPPEASPEPPVSNGLEAPASRLSEDEPLHSPPLLRPTVLESAPRILSGTSPVPSSAPTPPPEAREHVTPHLQLFSVRPPSIAASPAEPLSPVPPPPPEAPSAPPSPLPAPPFDQARIQAIFGSAECFDPLAITNAIRHLEGISSCVLLFNGEEYEKGSFPEDVTVERVKGFAEMLVGTNGHGPGGEVRSITLRGTDASLSVWAKRKACVCVSHAEPYLPESLQRKMQDVVDTLAESAA